ncbi:hypothetical protein ONS96_007421 [Cadophora gregata f. sp. sojae]|nr:hypothetical protein ONS96_007421 [Cadophora gregata f. sp. sojae]
MAQTMARQAAMADEDDISLTSTESEIYGSDAEFTVDRILAEKGPAKNKYYLISWEGYPEEKSTWEPHANVGSDTLQEWAERLEREKQGIDEPFNVDRFESMIKRLKEEKEDRHKRREAKRRRLQTARLEAIAAKRRRRAVRSDSDSSSEAMEENEVEDAQGMKIRGAAKRTQSGSKKQLKSPIKHATTKSTPQVQPDSSSEDVPLAKQKALARPRSLSSKNLAAQQQKQSDVQGIGRPSLPASRSSGKTAQSQTARGGKGATRGGSNVFQSRDRAKGERTLHKNAMDPTKKPRTFKTIQQQHIAEKQGRNLADRAPDVEQAGGLFDPSKPLQPIKATMIRKPTKQRAESEQPTSELFVPVHSPNSQLPEAVSAPAYQYSKPKSSREVCFFWHRNQQNGLEPGCVNKYDCTRYHHYEPGADISPAPPGYVGLDPKSTYSGPDVCWFWHRNQLNSKNPPCSNGDKCLRLHEYKEGAKILPPPGFAYPPGEKPPQATEQLQDDSPMVLDDDNFSHHDKPDVPPPWDEPVAASVRSEKSTSAQETPAAEQRSNKPDILPPWKEPAAGSVASDRRPYRSTCFFWDLAQKNSSNRCRNGSNCSNLHAYELGVPVALPPAGWVDMNAPQSFPTPTDTSSVDRPQGRFQSAQETGVDFIDKASSPKPVSNLKADQPSDSFGRPPWDPFRPTHAICHFWHERGTCTKGNDCTYFHDSDITLPVAPSISNQQRIRNDTPCRDWINGHCHKNDCWFLHKPRAVKNSTSLSTAPAPAPTLVPTLDPAGPRKATFDEAAPLTDKLETMLPTNSEFGDRYFRDIPPTELLGTLIQPSQRRASGPSTPAKDASSTGKGEPQVDSLGSRPSVQPKRRAWSPRDATNAICHFWHSGKCIKQHCEYLHSTDPTLPIAPHPFDLIARTTCPLWADKRCPKSAEECPYLHETTNFVPSLGRGSVSGSHDDFRETYGSGEPAVPQSTPTGARRKSVRFADDSPVAEPKQNAPADSTTSRDISSYGREGGSRIVCRYFNTGYCKRGTSCKFAHEDPSRQSQSYRDMDYEMPDAPHGEFTSSNTTPLPFNRMAGNERPQSDAPPSNVDKDIDMLRSEVTKLDVGQLASNPGQSAAPMKRKKVVSLGDYKKQKAVANVGERAKNLVFGYDAIHSAFFDFGEVKQGQDEPWKQEFLSTTQFIFNQLCMAQDLKLQQGLLHRRAFQHGSLQPADPSNPSMLKFVDHVAEELILRLGGLLTTCEHFAILLYPSKREEWSFLEQSSSVEARLCYLIFKHDIQPGSQDLPAKLEFGQPYRTLLADKIQGIRLKSLLPLIPKGIGKSPFKFFLMFPSSEKQMVQYFSAWILASNAESQIYDSLSEGSWDFFIKSTDGYGVVLIHESITPSLYQLPFLSRLLKHGYIAIWHVSDSTSLYPLYPSALLEPDPHVGRLRFTRLFPHGCAFLLTPSFIIAEPEYSYHILNWFLNTKFVTSIGGTWKLVCCHNFRGYLLDLANSKAKENQDFEREHKDKPAKDAMLSQKRLDFRHCDTRFKLYKALMIWQSKHTRDDSDSDSDRNDDNEYALVQAPKSIDQDDDEGLINWFAGWAMLRLDTFRKFPVIGTNSGNVALATRIKEIQVPKRDVATTTITIAEAEKPPSPASLQKQKALEIAARLGAANPNKVSSAMELDAKGDDSDVSMDIAESSPASRLYNHGTDARQSPDVLKFIAQTGCGPEDANTFLAKANGDLTRALELRRVEPFDSSFNELLNDAANGRHLPPITGGESNAQELNDKAAHRNTRVVDSIPQHEASGGSRNSSRDGSRRASLVMSPGEISLGSNDGENGGGGQSKKDRFQPVQEPQPRAAARTETDVDMDSYSDSDAELDVEMETISITKTFKATSAWYREQQAKGLKWEHITVLTQWEEMKSYLGVK